MQVNLKRGFIRLWTVASLFWIAAVTIVGWGAFNSTFQPQKGFIIAKDKPIIGFETWTAEYVAFKKSPKFEAVEVKDTDRTILLFPKGTVDNVTVDDAYEKVMKIRANESWQSKKKTISNHFFSAILPPITLLIFGMVVSWVFSGFRSQN